MPVTLPTNEPDGDDRFGMDPDVLRAVRETHHARHGVVCYVPTRHEVATLSPDLLLSILDGWMWRSPPELEPNAQQIDAVLRIVAKRPDATALGMLEGACRNYVLARLSAN